MSNLNRSLPQSGTVDDLREIVRTSLDPLERVMVRMQLNIIEAFFDESEHFGNVLVKDLVHQVGVGVGFGIWSIAEQMAANIDDKETASTVPVIIEFAGRLMHVQSIAIRNIISDVAKPSTEPLQ